jgi:hypothetical protein
MDGAWVFRSAAVYNAPRKEPQMPRVYLETSFVSACVTDRTDTDSLYRLKHSREWWDSQRHLHELYVSPEVIAELSVESYRCREKALAWIGGVPVLEINDDVMGLARVLIQEKAMPTGSGDPIHVAVAAVHGLQYMVSRNVKHLANVNKREHLARVCVRCGYIVPEILTPDVFWEIDS